MSSGTPACAPRRWCGLWTKEIGAIAMQINDKFWSRKAVLVLIILAALCASALAQENKTEIKTDSLKGNVSLIPREVFFGNPDRTSIMLSPDGSKISYLAPVNDVLNVWVGPVEEPQKARPVTNDTYRGISNYYWAYTNNHILYVQDKNGDENYHIYSVNLSNKLTKDLTPFNGMRSEIVERSYKIPDEIAIMLNKHDPRYFDLYRVNIETGNLTLIMENKDFVGFDVDSSFKVRLGYKTASNGDVEIFKLTDHGWEKFLNISMEDNQPTLTRGFDKNDDAVYLVDSRGRDTAALYALNLSTNNKTLIAEDPKSDLYSCMIHPTEKNVQAVAFNYERVHWKILDPTITNDMDYLFNLTDGDMWVASRSLDDKAWIVAYIMDNGPTQCYYYDRTAKKARFLFTDRDELQNLTLAKMVPVVIKSRDGLDLVNYYTLPPGSDTDGDGIPDKPLPMVLLVHGGPAGRDVWGYSSNHQWLANRGYAILSVNFRGSTGFGKSFTNAGNLEWGRKMQNDLLDVVNWSVQQGIADPGHIAIMGESYGGYAALAGLTFTPDVFACGVDLYGPSNLTTMLSSMAAYVMPDIASYTTRIGDSQTRDGQKLLTERSPINYVDRIKRPLLVAQGANDVRVKKNESDQIVQAMQEKNLSVIYALFPDEGHAFTRPLNRIAFDAVAEAFLAQHLGGRFETISASDLLGSSITVPVGAKEIPGLEAALFDIAKGNMTLSHIV